MIEKIFLDAYAWIEILEETEKGSRITSRIKDQNLHTPLLNYYEVLLKYKREAPELAEEVSAEIKGITKVVIPEEEIVELATVLKLENPQLSMADAISFATAVKNNGVLVTGDKDFKDIKNKHIKYFK